MVVDLTETVEAKLELFYNPPQEPEEKEQEGEGEEEEEEMEGGEEDAEQEGEEQEAEPE